MNLETVDFKQENIDLKDLQFLTRKTFTHDDVFDNNRKYSTTYKHIVDSYGFSSFYDLYLFAYNQTETLSKSNNQTEKVSKSIVRNNKEITLEVQGDYVYKKGKRFNGGLDKEPNPKDLVTTLTELDRLGVSIEDIPTDRDVYLTIEKNSVEGFAWLTVKDMLHLEGHKTVGTKKSIELPMMFLVIKKASKMNKGIKVFNIQDKKGRDIMKTLGFKYKENYYELTREKTLKFYGDFVDTIM